MYFETKLKLKVMISKIFTLLSFVALMVIIGNCRCVFGPQFPSFLVCSHRSFLCLSGHNNRFLATLAETGKKQYTASHTGDFKFVSVTYRLFKVPKGNTKPCQVIYDGKITGAEDSFQFDSQYTFKVNEVVEVDGEVATILTHSRFAEDFTFKPPGGPCEPCAVKPKAGIVDPFKLVTQLEKQSPGSATGGCCSTQSATCCK